MWTKRASRVLGAAVLLWSAAPGAQAQSFGVDVEAGYRTLAASKSAKAIFGSDGGTTVGGSVQYMLGMGLFFRAGARTFSAEGERVFLADANSTPYPLGFPLEAKITSFDILAGWRFRLGGRTRDRWRFAPYAAVGVEFASYEEESTVAGLVETNDASKTGFQAVAGLEVRVVGGLTLSAEGGYSSVSSVLGVGGVSQIYGEDDIGGFRVVGRLGYRF